METNNQTRSVIASKLFDFLRLNERPCSIVEMANYIADVLNLTERQKNDRFKSGDVKYVNMMRFALLTYKKAGLVKNVSRGLWSITKKGASLTIISEADYLKLQKKVSRESNVAKRSTTKNSVVQQELFGLNKKKVSRLSGREVELLSEIVKQNNLIIEKLLNK